MSIATLLVTGVSGGLGASMLTAALARGISKTVRPVVLLDLDLRGGGLDVTCGVEHVEGLRWADLRRMAGPVPGRKLIDALPGPQECKLLSAGPPLGSRSRPALPHHAFVGSVLSSLTDTDRVVVADLPRHQVSALRAEVASTSLRPTLWLILIGATARSLADLDALLGGLDAEEVGSRHSLAIVTSGPAPQHGLEEEISRHVGLPVIGHLPWSRPVSRSAERGEWPRGPAYTAVVREACRRLPEARAA